MSLRSSGLLLLRGIRAQARSKWIVKNWPALICVIPIRSLRTKWSRMENKHVASKDRLAGRDLAARAEHDHVAVRVLCAEDQQLGREARDVLRTQITRPASQAAPPAHS